MKTIEFNNKNDIDELEKSLEDEQSSSSILDIIDESMFNNLFSNNIVFTPRIGRLSNNNKKIFNKITSSNFKDKIKEDIISNYKKVNKNNFFNFKKKYKSIIQNQYNVMKKAMSIKDDNKNYLNDIQTFLKSNGIMLFVKYNIDMELKDLDGFSCFYNEYPVIVIYDKKDKRRMLFTIMHELYHLMYDENESFADKFAGSALLTIKDIENSCPEVVKDKNYIEKHYVNTLKIICLNNFVSVRAATKTLLNFNYLSKEEIEYEKYFDEIREYIENKNIEITIKSIDVK